MKRNNLFMLAYIIFIIVCMFVRLICDYPMWHTIVSAITISSWFFAVADASSSDAEYLKQQIRIWLQFTEAEKVKAVETLDWAKAEKQYVTENRDRYDEDLLKEKLVILNDVIGRMEHRIKDDETVDEELEPNNKKAQKYERVAEVCTIFGFLTFFCIMSFQTISKLVVSLQDVTTVAAFAIILATQYISEQRRLKNNAFEHRSAALLENWSSLCDNVKESMSHAD